MSIVLPVTLLMGLAFVSLVPRGLPYDEPSHWQNVEYYAAHWQMPQIGDPGTSYEAQMGPVAYVALAILSAPARSVSTEAAFYAARFSGLLVFAVLVLLMMRMVRRTLPTWPRADLLAGLAIGLNPMLQAMSTSVQNDTVALLLAVAAVDVATGSRRDLTRRRATVAGILAGLALLAKITMWPLLLVLGLSLLWRRAWAATLLYGGVTVLVSGWWFVRNMALYGDLTGRAAVDAAGYDFPPGGSSPFETVRSMVAYLWLPTEYVRNTVTSPTWLDLLLGLLTVVCSVGLVRAYRRPTNPAILLAVAAVLAVSGWLATTWFVQGVAFRFAYAALPAWWVGIGALSGSRRWPQVLLLAGLVIADVWFLAGVADLPSLLDFDN